MRLRRYMLRAASLLAVAVLSTSCVVGDPGSGSGGAQPQVAMWYLREPDASGQPQGGTPDERFAFGIPGYRFVSGDWSGTLADSPGVFVDGWWYLRNTNSPGQPDLAIQYGASGYTPVVGRWGVSSSGPQAPGDGIGVFVDGSWYLRNSTSPGRPDLVIQYGSPSSTPVVGDWDGNGTDTIGVFDNGWWYLRNSNTPGPPDLTINYGSPSDTPVVGRWGVTSSGRQAPGDGIGVFVDGWWYLRNSTTPGQPDLAIQYGASGDTPVVETRLSGPNVPSRGTSLLGVVVPSPAPGDPPSQYCHNATPASAADYQAAFGGLRAANTGGWIGNDGGLPVTLTDGRVIWLFGDTLLGSPPALSGMAHNGFVIQTGRCFRPVTGPIPDPAPNEWVWPTGTVQQGNTLQVVGFHMRHVDTPPFPFQLVNFGVASFSLPQLSLQSFTVLPLPTSPTYGETILADGQYVYAYGQTREPVASGFPIPRHYAARAPLGGILDASAWRFWQNVPAGQDPWASNNPQDADPMLFDNSETGGPLSPMSVGFNGSYVGSAFPVDAFVTDIIQTWSGASPGGPWTLRPSPAVTGVNTWYGQLAFPTHFAYGGRVIFNIAGSPIAQWSTNYDSIAAVLADPNLYTVWFATPLPGSIP